MREQEDPTADPFPAKAEQGPVVLKVAAFSLSEGSEAFRQKDGGAFEIGEITGWRFDGRECLQLVQIILQVAPEKVQALHQKLMRHHFSAGCKFSPPTQ